MLNKIPDAIKDIKAGKFIIVVDDENRENEGDLVCAASKITAKHVNFMIKEARGLVCVPMEEKDLFRLNLDSMVKENTESHQTDFTVSVDARKGITTGISASDRAKTIKTLINKKTLVFSRITQEKTRAF